jgi:tagatose-1,6-bisphosphate aldolase non-catalytic subunit AgaZ/GatZ
MKALLSLAQSRRDGWPGVSPRSSACALVVRAAARHADTLLIEAACSQVNQFGSYTGMRLADFVGLIGRIASERRAVQLTHNQ